MCALDAFKSRIRNSRVDVHTDSRAVLGSWQSEGGSSTEKNDVIKAVLRCSQEFNFSINMQHVPSAENSTDAPSRRQSDLDCTLSEEACLGHIPLTSCPSTVTAAVIYMVIVFHISHRATPLSHPASTCLRSSCLSGKTFMFFSLCTYRSAPPFLY